MNNADPKLSPESPPPAPFPPPRVLRYFVRLSNVGEASHPCFRIRWRRVLTTITGGLVLLCILLVCSVFLLVRYGQHLETIGILDLLLPSRWNRYTVARGDHQVKTAQMLVGEGHRLEALMLVRQGVARSPVNRDGRLLLAQLLIEARRAGTARQILLDGFGYHRNDPIYLRSLLSFLLQQQEDTRVITLARASLRSSPAPTECDCLLALAAATASYFRGNYDQADDFLHLAPSLAHSRDGLLLVAKIDWDRGYRDLALLQLRTLSAQLPNDSEIQSELTAHLREHGLHDEARRSSLAFQFAHPDLPGPRIGLLNAYQRMGDRGRIAREAAALLRDFPSDPAALLALADFAANSGNVALARQLDEHTRASGLPHEAHCVLVVEALIVAHKYQAALETIHSLLRENQGWDTRYASLLDSLQAVAHYGLGDHEAARIFLASSLNQAGIRAESLLAIARRLADVNADEAARQALLRAVEADPLNQAALTTLVELDLNLNRIGELPGHLRRLLAMRKPSPDVLRVAQHKLGSDLFLFSTDRAAVLEGVRVALEKTPGALRDS